MAIDPSSIGFAGQFVLETAIIITADNQTVDITAEISEISIYEDTLNPVLSGTLVFSDNFNIQNLMPLIGQELLKLKLKTPSLEFQDDIIDFTEQVFFLHNSEAQIQTSGTNQTLVLNFISMEAMFNQRKTVSKTFKGTYSSIVESILRGELQSTKRLFIEPSRGLKQVLATDEHPFDLIEMAKAQALSVEMGAPSYLFYETMWGFHFRSLESLYAEKNKGTYTTDHTRGKTTLPHGQPNILQEFSKIHSYNIDMSADTLGSSANGTYGSSLITHDIFNKTYSTSTYNYFDTFKNEHNINDLDREGRAQSHPLYSESPVDEDGNTVADFASKSYLLPVSIKDTAKQNDAHFTTSKGTYPFSAYNPNTWLQRSKSKTSQLNAGLSVSMRVNGHTAIHAGDIVEINLPYNAMSKSGDNESVDKFYRGPFMIRSLHHTFSQISRSHQIYMTCVKDCLDKPLPLGESTPVPKTQLRPTELIEFYNL